MSTEPHRMSNLQTDDLNPSDSAVQREIELVMLRRLGEQHGDWQPVAWRTIAAELGMSSVWQKTEPDAVWRTDSASLLLAEAYARVGDLKPGHRRKLAMDALKLLALRNALPDGTDVRCLLIVPEELKVRLQGDGWFPVALHLAAEIVPVTLLDDERKRLLDASSLQGQGQSRTRRRGKVGAE